jgi:hypothetical protein
MPGKITWEFEIERVYLAVRYGHHTYVLGVLNLDHNAYPSAPGQALLQCPLHFAMLLA